MTHTFLQSESAAIARLAGRTKAASVRRSRRGISALTRRLRDGRNRCMICPRIEETTKRYAFTVVHSWEQDPEFRERFLGSRGLCMVHYAACMDMAAEVLPARQLKGWCGDVAGLQRRNAERMEKGLAAFTARFDYQRSAGDWEGEREALPRALQWLSGPPAATDEDFEE